MMIISPIFEGPQIIVKQLDTSLGKLISFLPKYIFGKRKNNGFSIQSGNINFFSKVKIIIY